jgi:trimethylamine--corrinoid protein Co-methyltransferase
MSKTVLMNRQDREHWEAAGSKEIADLAYEKSLEILENYKPEPRPDAVQKELDRIYTEFEARVKERKEKEAAKSK